MIEADFQREYRINLATEASRMSWRRFLVLLRGLGPWSALAWTLGGSGGQQVRVIEDAGEAERYVDRLLG